jgi:hypothetical protein
MAESNKEKIRKYYETAWKQVYDELACQLLAFGFAPKSPDGKFEIGNVHGQVYACPAETSKIQGTLLFLLINPTNTGKLSIKLTFQDKSKFLNLVGRINSGISPKPLGKPEITKDGRFAAEYFFYSEPRPADPTEASGILLETAITWLEAITSSEG